MKWVQTSARQAAIKVKKHEIWKNENGVAE